MVRTMERVVGIFVGTCAAFLFWQKRCGHFGTWHIYLQDGDTLIDPWRDMIFYETVRYQRKDEDWITTQRSIMPIRIHDRRTHKD